jgi:salicylate hydroxylase
LLGDACHPTLPYQAQGAAMAVEDGAIIGRLLGKLNRQLRNGSIARNTQCASITRVLQLYEECQKKRTTINVQGAVNNRHFYHMTDGLEQMLRDKLLALHTWTDERSEYTWCDMRYHAELLDVDVLANADTMFDNWFGGQGAISRHNNKFSNFFNNMIII